MKNTVQALIEDITTGEAGPPVNNAGGIDPPGEFVSMRVFSKVLRREIMVSWDPQDPSIIFVDRTSYTTREIEKLKTIAPSGVRAAHKVKSTFIGSEVSS